ncbi:hypothetical protein ACHAXR_003886 [Thalassiosira sp. AJA248-18]
MPFASSNATGRQKSSGHHSKSSSADADAATTTIPSSITKQCLQLHHPDQRFSNEAVELSSELLRMFVVEARRRAAIEAECEAETKIDPSTEGKKCQPSNQEDDDGSDSFMMLDDDKSKKATVEIRADHIAKIAAELLLDLS